MSLLAEVKLTAPVPELCYGCHDDFTTTGRFVHGPVAVEQCMFCHVPHEAANRFLLKKSVPQLCYMCHSETDIRAIAEHQTERLSGCTVCHEGHSGSTKGLLRQDAKEKTN